MADAKEGISMLAQLAGRIVDTKATAGARLSPGLTPVAGEITAGLPRTPAAFPYDVPNDVVRQAIQRIEAEISSLDGVVNALKLLIGDVAAGTAIIAQDTAITQRLLEREADRRVADQQKAAAGDKKAAERVNTASPMAEVIEAAEAKDRKRAAVLAAMMDAPDEPFETRMARLSAAAQSSAFGHQPVDSEGGLPGPWTCPQHGDTSIAVKVSPRRGVQFRKCAVADCHEFEKV